MARLSLFDCIDGEEPYGVDAKLIEALARGGCEFVCDCHAELDARPCEFAARTAEHHNDASPLRETCVCLRRCLPASNPRLLCGD
jgi:hypothetical protein